MNPTGLHVTFFSYLIPKDYSTYVSPSETFLPHKNANTIGTHDKVYFTSSVCLCVDYKMKTCTQISDSGFRGEINVVSPSDSAKRASPGRRAGFSPCKREVKSSTLTRTSPIKRAGLPSCKHFP